jgi:hypothetical protein
MCFFVCLFVFCGTGACTQGLHLESFHQAPFLVCVMVFFEIGFLELFAQAGFKP